MQPDPRPFQAISVGMTGVEHGAERFTRNNFYNGPSLALWRCNLTALSQKFNLYFVATREGVAVYQPNFPFQKLSNRPALYIPPTLANDSAEGYIDQDRPHGINHLVVGDLGTEEILLVATDSGNIAAYHTKAIEEATKRDPYSFSSNASSELVGLRAFFSSWVHESAWGLDIHREARMIAVSANRPYHIATDDLSAKITVFAFALTSSNPDTPSTRDASEEQQEWYDWNSPQSEVETPYRDRNFKITLGGEKGHITNIPSVSFFNTPEDRTGSWLLSTDINGTMKLWRIWKGLCHASYDCEGTHLGPNMPRQRDSGWLVAALDPSIFRPATSMDQFCGFHRARPAPQYQGRPGDSYDITNIVRLKTPGRSQKHPMMGHDSSDDEDAEDQEEIAEEWSDEDVEDADRKRNLVLGLDSLHLPRDETSVPSPPAQQTTMDLSGRESLPSLSLQGTIVASTEVTPTENAPFNPFLARDAVALDTNSDEEFDSEEEGTRSSSGSPVSQQTQRTSVEPAIDASPDLSGQNDISSFKKPSPTPSSKRQRNASQAEAEIRVPIITALQCSQYHVRLINVPQARSPHFFCANILNQDLPRGVERSNFVALARLSMMQQIPELGIVIVASQLGRCAVCTLTRNTMNGASGFRVDWTLPTLQQERAGYRPRYPLLGIAVAPIQGRNILQQESSSTEQSDSESWAKDHTLYGVKTTFDTSILVLDGNQREHRSGSDESDEATSSRLRTRSSLHTRTRSKTKPHKKRARRTSTAQSTTWPSSSSQPCSYSSSDSSSIASTATRPFGNLAQNEPWKAVEPSRRYRLMLTYLDNTVLTYELERGIEREDTAGIAQSSEERSESDERV